MWADLRDGTCTVMRDVLERGLARRSFPVDEGFRHGLDVLNSRIAL
jgi:hypothetical protein